MIVKIKIKNNGFNRKSIDKFVNPPKFFSFSPISLTPKSVILFELIFI